MKSILLFTLGAAVGVAALRLYTDHWAAVQDVVQQATDKVGIMLKKYGIAAEDEEPDIMGSDE